jgi:hypothetical protein
MIDLLARFDAPPTVPQTNLPIPEHTRPNHISSAVRIVIWRKGFRALAVSGPGPEVLLE